MTTWTVFAVLMTTAIMYVFLLSAPILLKSLFVEAQETTNNNITTSSGTIDISNNLKFGNPFYEATSGKVISQRVLDTTSEGASQIELSIIQKATMKGVGNITNLATWTNTFKTAEIVYGIGKGVITTDNGEMANWIANDIGRSDDKGVITYNGLIFFNTVNSPSTAGGKLAFLNNMPALFVTQVNVSTSERPQATKMWEWK